MNTPSLTRPAGNPNQDKLSIDSAQALKPVLKIVPKIVPKIVSNIAMNIFISTTLTKGEPEKL